jgi:RimJ/RimL family protein N-acetyltransferase
MGVILDTERLRLSPVQPADRDDLYALEQDAEVMRYLNGGRPTPLVPPPELVTAYRMPRGQERDVWAARRRDTGAFVGWFALKLGEGATGNLGYRLRRDVWRQGYGLEGAAALVDHGFRTLGLALITADTMAVNLGSRRIMEKLGMRWLRDYQMPSHDPVPGEAEGEVEYGITAEAWLRR